MITGPQQQLINHLKKVGYGWGKFAASVEAQGACSEAQEATMRRMKKKIKAQRDKIWHAKHSKNDYTSITDGEIMSFGLEI